MTHPAAPSIEYHIVTDADDPATLPDHTQLPESDGTFVKNFQEHPQSILLTDSLDPVFQQLHPDGQYCIGQDSGIYWSLTQPRHKGAEAPDWFYVPNVPPSLDGQMRRSYVLWKEKVPPLIVLEFVSGSGREELDRTPYQGKFWVYEQIIKPKYYGIYTVTKPEFVLYKLVNNRYQLVPTNQQNRHPIPDIGVELGLWNGTYKRVDLPWLRAWDSDGNLLLTGEERAELERQRTNQAVLQYFSARQQAEQAMAQVDEERLRSARLAAKLRELGINPDEV